MGRLSRTSPVVAIALVILFLLTACGQSGVGSESTAAAVQAPAGWNRYTGGGAAIYLPPGYDTDLKDPTTVEDVRARGGAWESLLSGMEQQGLDQWALFVLDSLSFTANQMDFVMIGKFEIASNLSLEAYVDARVANLTGSVRERTSATVAGLDAVQVTYGDATGNVLQAYVKSGHDVWEIGFFTGAANPEQRLADFQTSLSTFRIQQ